jgi:hypothetical protein
VTTRFIIDPTQSDQDIVDFIVSVLEEDGAFEESGVILPLRETRLIEHPGHGDQKAHGRRGTGRVSEPAAAAYSLTQGGTPNVTSADLDDVMRSLATDAPPQVNLMNLYVDGHRVTGDMGLPFPRSQMPQFDGDVKSRFVAEMEASGVKVTRKTVDPSTLTPGQNEIDARKTGMMFDALDRGAMGAQDPILTSSDDRVMDGNHRYAALSVARQDGHPNMTIDTIQIDMPSATLLPLMQSWVANGIANRGLGT